MGFAQSLSRAGVRYLAASPETMVAPGVPTTVAEDIASSGDARSMARAVVDDVMQTRYDAGPLGSYGGAAAFDVLDLDPQKMARAQASIKRLDDALVAQARDPIARARIRDDIARASGEWREFRERTAFRGEPIAPQSPFTTASPAIRT